MTQFRVVHATHYRYATPVTASYGEHRLLPRSTPHQHVRRSAVLFEPAPGDVRERYDLHGNRVGWFAIHDPHLTLDVVAWSDVRVHRPAPATTEVAWEQVRDRVAAATDPAGIEARAMVLASPQVQPGPELRELAAGDLAPGRPIVEAFRALVRTIAREFAFDPTATTVTTPVDEVLARRAGVCQDFAHLLVGALRSHRLPARYVSGYIETDPPPGGERLVGADASHAWAAVYVPGHGWVDADPTNDQLVADRHVTLAWGRDYGDVAPLKGVIHTDGPTEELAVAVDVVRHVPVGDGTPALPPPPDLPG